MTSGSLGQPFGRTAPYHSAPLALHCRERVVKDPTLCGMALLVGLLPALLFGAIVVPALVIGASSRMVKDTFGFTVRTNLRVLTPWLLVALLSLLVAIIGAVLAARFATDVPTWSAAGVVLAVLGGLGFFVACGFQTAVSACVNTLIYRHGLGLPTLGIDQWSLPRRLS
jgi:hypothetical protein